MVELYLAFSFPEEHPRSFFKRALLSAHPDKGGVSPPYTVQDVLRARALWRSCPGLFEPSAPRTAAAAPAAAPQQQREHAEPLLTKLVVTIAALLALCALAAMRGVVAAVCSAAVPPAPLRSARSSSRRARVETPTTK